MISLVGTIILGLLLWGLYNFGDTFVASTTIFYTFPANCLQKEEGISYVIPNIFGSKTVLIPIDKNTNKILGGFMGEASELECSIEQKEIGKVIK